MTEMYAGKPGRPAAGMTVIPGGDGTPIPKPPRALKDVATWNRLWTIGRSWLSNDAHYDLMRLLVEAMEDRDRIRNVAKRASVMGRGSMGQQQIHPAFKALDAAETKIARLLNQAGFTPAAQRTRVSSPAKPSKLDTLRANAKSRTG